MYEHLTGKNNPAGQFVFNNGFMIMKELKQKAILL